MPSKDMSTPSMIMAQAFDSVYVNGYRGHYPWRSNGSEEHGNLSHFGAASLSFKNNHSNIVNSTCSINSLNSFIDLEFIRVFPAPFNNTFEIISPSDKIDFLNIRDLNGKVVWSAPGFDDRLTIVVPQIPSGLYILEIIRSDTITQHKLIKE